jgi:peptidoglycan/LPS O-acetylase OafA/YrhL
MKPVSPQRSAYRPEIDGLRGIAILSVIAYHFGFRHSAGGFVGVDVFFVISGFLITLIILRALDSRDFTLGWFWERRIRRIFPALIVSLIATLGIGWILMSPEEYKELGKSALAAASSCSNLYFSHHTGYFDGRSTLKSSLRRSCRIFHNVDFGNMRG